MAARSANTVSDTTKLTKNYLQDLRAEVASLKEEILEAMNALKPLMDQSEDIRSSLQQIGATAYSALEVSVTAQGDIKIIYENDVWARDHILSMDSECLHVPAMWLGVPMLGWPLKM